MCPFCPWTRVFSSLPVTGRPRGWLHLPAPSLSHHLGGKRFVLCACNDSGHSLGKIGVSPSPQFPSVPRAQPHPSVQLTGQEQLPAATSIIFCAFYRVTLTARHKVSPLAVTGNGVGSLATHMAGGCWCYSRYPAQLNFKIHATLSRIVPEAVGRHRKPDSASWLVSSTLYDPDQTKLHQVRRILFLPNCQTCENHSCGNTGKFKDPSSV